jgi:hypothetical protein
MDFEGKHAAVFASKYKYMPAILFGPLGMRFRQNRFMEEGSTSRYILFSKSNGLAFEASCYLWPHT